MTDRAAIKDRIDAALEKVRCQQQIVQSINLNKADMRALDRVNSQAFAVKGCKVHSCSYRGHVVKLTTNSYVYTTIGAQFYVPKLLSKRVAA